MSANPSALKILERACRIYPDVPEMWLALSHEYIRRKASAKAAAAHRQYETLLGKREPFATIETLLSNGDLDVAQRLLQGILFREPNHSVALRLLSHIALRMRRYEDARSLLLRCLKLSPVFLNARLDLATALFHLREYRNAIACAKRLLKDEPLRISAGMLLISCLTAIGDFEEARTRCEHLIALVPDRAEFWLQYARILGILGRLGESVVAYRRCIAIAPGNSAAYCGLANLKTYRFSDPEIEEMTNRLAAGGAREDMARFHFALGKALEDRGDDSAAMQSYATGNRIKREAIRSNGVAPETTMRTVRALKSTFSTRFFRRRHGWGCDRSDPIFIVSLPRSGSTLVEQILSSHSQVEATMELDEIECLVGGISPGETNPASTWARICRLSPVECAELGREYIAHTQVYRKTKKPYFIDKMPGNYLHLGFIHLILPKARLVEVRREAVSACVANFVQMFGRGHSHSYDLAEMGRFYLYYCQVADHFAETLPGKVHRVSYERLVTDTETDVRKLLRYCNLDFEPACLTFYENERYVRTPSGYQVRRPIYRDGSSRWRKFDEWLTPLRSALAAGTMESVTGVRHDPATLPVKPSRATSLLPNLWQVPVPAQMGNAGQGAVVTPPM